MLEPTKKDVKQEIKRFNKQQEAMKSNVIADIDKPEIYYSWCIVSHINNLWTAKKIKGTADKEPRGFGEKKKENVKTKDYYTTVIIHCKDKMTYEYNLTSLEYKWYRFFRKLRLGC